MDCRVGVTLSIAAWSLRRMPGWSGYSRVTNSIAIRRLCAPCEGEVEAVLRNGVKMPVRLGDFNGRMLFLFGQTDPKVIRVCQRMLGVDDVFLDIGANHGEVGLLCVDQDAPHRQIHVFEPIPELARKIREAAVRHSLEGVVVHACGLGRTNDRLPLAYHAGHTGKASLVPSKAAGDTSIVVPIRRVSDLLDEMPPTRPLGAKVDVEGAEGEIVPDLLACPATRFVVFEWEHLADPGLFLDLAQQHGFSIYGLEKRLWCPRLVPSDAIEASVSDVVAVRRTAMRNDLAWRRIDSLTRGDLR